MSEEQESATLEDEAEKREEAKTADEIYRQVLMEVLDEKEKRRLQRYGEYVDDGVLHKVE